MLVVEEVTWKPEKIFQNNLLPSRAGVHLSGG
jgi:hypothetical protein